MEFHILRPGRPPDLIARTGDGWLEIIPPAKPVPAPPIPAAPAAG